MKNPLQLFTAILLALLCHTASADPFTPKRIPLDSVPIYVLQIDTADGREGFVAVTLIGYCGGDPVNRVDPMGTYWKFLLKGVQSNGQLDISIVWVDDATNEVVSRIGDLNLTKPTSAEFAEAEEYFLNGIHAAQDDEGDAGFRFLRWEFANSSQWSRPLAEKAVDPTYSNKWALGFGLAGDRANDYKKQFPAKIAKGVAEWYLGAGIMKGVQGLARAGDYVNALKYARRPPSVSMGVTPAPKPNWNSGPSKQTSAPPEPPKPPEPPASGPGIRQHCQGRRLQQEP